MREVLRVIGKEFNASKVLWAIGGSLVLKEYSIVERANDIDILISPKDVDVVLEIMNNIGLDKTPPNKAEYSTDVFMHFEVLGVGVDIMAGFKINHAAGVYEFKFDSDSITKYDNDNDVIIPYSSLEEWYVAYSLMQGREEKAELIEEYFAKNGIKHIELIVRALQQKLPGNVKEKLEKIIE